MLTEETVVDDIRMNENGTLLVRRATYILRDGVRTGNGPSYLRRSYEPGDDVSHEDPRVQAIAATWTDAMKAAAVARRTAIPLHTLATQAAGEPNGEA